MSARRRYLLIGLLALATLALAWFAPPPEPVVPATRQAQGAASAASPLLPPLREWPARRDWGRLPASDAPVVPMREAEAAKAAAAAAKPAVPATPSTPKLPFRFLGSLGSEGSSTTFLAAGNDSFIVRPGASLPGGWRFDGASPDRLDFTFLPTDSRQSLTIPAP